MGPRVLLFNTTGALSLQFTALWRGFMLADSACCSAFVYIYFQPSPSKVIYEQQRLFFKKGVFKMCPIWAQNQCVKSFPNSKTKLHIKDGMEEGLQLMKAALCTNSGGKTEQKPLRWENLAPQVPASSGAWENRSCQEEKRCSTACWSNQGELCSSSHHADGLRGYRGSAWATSAGCHSLCLLQVWTWGCIEPSVAIRPEGSVRKRETEFGVKWTDSEPCASTKRDQLEVSWSDSEGSRERWKQRLHGEVKFISLSSRGAYQ